MRAATLEAKASGVSAIHTLWPCVRPRPADPEEADTTTRPIAIATSTLMFVPAKAVVGTSTRLLSREGAQIGHQAQQTDAFIDRGSGRLAEVRQQGR